MPGLFSVFLYHFRRSIHSQIVPKIKWLVSSKQVFCTILKSIQIGNFLPLLRKSRKKIPGLSPPSSVLDKLECLVFYPQKINAGRCRSAY
jgi:hypothetical protein